MLREKKIFSKVLVSVLAAAMCTFIAVAGVSAEAVNNPATQGSGSQRHLATQGLSTARLQLADPKAQPKQKINPNIAIGGGGADGCLISASAGIETGNELWGTSDTACNGDTIEISVKNYWLFCTSYFGVCWSWAIKANGSQCIRQLVYSVNCPYYSDYHNASSSSLWAYESNVCVTFLDGFVACGSVQSDVWTN